METTLFSKKQFILFFIGMFLNTQLIISQSIEQNLEKYWHYRYRLTHYFMVIGEGQGESLPADIRNSWNIAHADWRQLEWNETLVQSGHYIGVLATEYYLLKQNNQNTDQTLTELYYALKAVERLDINAEIEWGLSDFTSETNGFLICDDVPSDFLITHGGILNTIDGTYNYDNCDLNLNLPPAPFISPGYGTSGYVKDIKSTFIINTPLAIDDKSLAPSQDMLYNLLMGLALCKRFVTDYPWGYDDNSYITFINTITNSQTSYNFNYFVRDEGDKIIRYMRNSPFSNLDLIGSAHDVWNLEKPDGHQLANDAGGNASWFSFGVAAIGKYFTGGDYQNQVSVDRSWFWQNNQDHESFRANYAVQLPLIIATVGDAWLSKEWVYIPSPFDAIFGVHWGTSERIGPVYNSTKEGIQFQGDYGAGPLDAWPASHYGMDIYYGAIHRLLHGNNWWDNPILDICKMQSILNSAPPEGPYNHSSSDKDPNSWACSRRFYNAPPQQDEGKNGFEGNYNGLDYMLMHNLYYCMQETDANLVHMNMPNNVGSFGIWGLPGPYYYVGNPFQLYNTKQKISIQHTNIARNESFLYGAAIITGGPQGVELDDVVVIEGAELTVSTTDDCGVDPEDFVYNAAYYRKAITMTDAQNNAGNDSLPQYRMITEAEIQKSFNLLVSPNPNTGIFRITITKNQKSTGIKELKVMDVFGKAIWQTGASTNTVFDVDISKYAQGIYYVHSINDEGEIEIKKLVKQ